MMQPQEQTVQLPHSIELEQALLGCVLNSQDAYGRIQGFLKPEHFFEPIHAIIYERVQDAVAAGQNISPLTVALNPPEMSDDLKRTLKMTFAQYVALLCREAVGVSNVQGYASLIHDLYLRRKVEELGQAIVENARTASHTDSAADLVTNAVSELDAILADDDGRKKTDLAIGEAADRAVDAINTAYQNNGALVGMTWGLKDLDDKTSGIHKGRMVIVGARTSVGKSAFALSSLLNTASAGHGVLYVSLEMTAEELTLRAISDIMHADGGLPIPYFRLHKGHISEKDFERVNAAREMLKRLPIRIEEQAGLSVQQIVARSRRARTHFARQGVSLEVVCVDHLHIVSGTERYGSSKVAEVGQTSGALKAMAKDLNVGVIALCQLNRASDHDGGRRPMLADLKYSGDIEQDADTVILIYREAQHIEQKLKETTDNDTIGELNARLNQVRNQMELLIEKQRMGARGVVNLYCDMGSNAIRNLERRHGVPA